MAKVASPREQSVDRPVDAESGPPPSPEGNVIRSGKVLLGTAERGNENDGNNEEEEEGIGDMLEDLAEELAEELAEQLWWVEALMDWAPPVLFLLFTILLVVDVCLHPACEAGTVVEGPDEHGYYSLLRCVAEDQPGNEDDDLFTNAALVDIEDDEVLEEMEAMEDQLTCTTVRTRRPCDMGRIFICEGVLDSDFLFTRVCAFIWSFAQVYLAIPILLGGINTCEVLHPLHAQLSFTNDAFLMRNVTSSHHLSRSQSPGPLQRILHECHSLTGAAHKRYPPGAQRPGLRK